MSYIKENAQPLTIAEKLELIAENEQKIYDAGKQAEHDAFWGQFTDNGARTYYGDAFRESTLEYIRPNYKIRPTYKGGVARTFYSCKKLKKVEADYVDFSQIPYGSYASEGYYNTFTMCYELEEIEDIGFVPCFGYISTFNVCRKLRKIAKIRVDKNTQFIDDTFGSCKALEDITFEGEIGQDINFKWSKKLTRESIENIINHLSDEVRGNTLTLSRAAVDEAFAWAAPAPDGGVFEYSGTDEGSGNDWYPLVATKPHWTIHLYEE